MGCWVDFDRSVMCSSQFWASWADGRGQHLILHIAFPSAGSGIWWRSGLGLFVDLKWFSLSSALRERQSSRFHDPTVGWNALNCGGLSWKIVEGFLGVLQLQVFTLIQDHSCLRIRTFLLLLSYKFPDQFEWNWCSATDCYRSSYLIWLAWLIFNGDNSAYVIVIKHTFDTGLHSNACEPTSFKFRLLIDTTKLYTLIIV